MSKSIFLKVIDKLRSGSMFGSLLRGSGIVFIIQVLGRGLGYLSQVLLARWMGASEYGLYIYVISWATLAATPAQLGQRGAVVRFIPEYKINNETARLRGVVQGSLSIVLCVAILLSFTATVVSYILHSKEAIQNIEVILIGIWMMPLIAVIQVNSSIMQSFRRMVATFAPMTLARPLLILLGACILYFQARKPQSLNSTSILLVTFFVFLLILISQLWMIRREVLSIAKKVPAVYEIRNLLRVSIPLLLSAGFTKLLVQSDIAMIGLIRGPEDVGLYNAAVRSAALIGFILTSVSATAAPMISATYAEGNPQKLQKLILRTKQIMLVPSLFIMLGVVVFAKPILSNFGDTFISMQWVLVILATGQFIKATSGPIGLLLDLTGFQDDSAKLRGVTATLNVVLNVIGIYLLGPLGAALATVTSIVVERAYTDYIVVKRINISPSWFSYIRETLFSVINKG